MRHLRVALIVVGAGACTAAPPNAGARPDPSAIPRRDAPPAASAAAPVPSADAQPRDAARRTSGEAEQILFPEGGDTSRCPEHADGDDAERIRCLVALRFERDPEAARLARALFDASGSIAGVERDHVMNGGFRGAIHLVPEAPVDRYRAQLAWVTEASQDFERFFHAIEGHANKPLRYRWRGLAFRFFRSVGRTTPSAYAADWGIGYNVVGSLNRSADGVRETLFHEIFHLNDQEHGWSRAALGATYDAIVARCGTRAACLARYAPNGTMVRGGTYYAFQPNNGDGVAEYAAELAVRYYREQRSFDGDAPAGRPFKCGPDENARAWALIVDEFFGGADVTPPC